MAKLPETLVLEMTRKRALELGLITCMCGHPENNHFDWKPQPCAHCNCRELREIPKRGIKLK
jgi:hypothetical protein